jgi:stage III sporulation protein SpoIIIAA
MARGTLQPGHQIEASRAIQQHRIAVKQVRHDDKVAICCQLIRNQLGINEPMADYISE